MASTTIRVFSILLLVFSSSFLEVHGCDLRLQAGGIKSIKSVFLFSLGIIAVHILLVLCVRSQMKKLSQRAPKVEVGTATADASMDEWLQKYKREPEVEVGTATVDASMDECLQKYKREPEVEVGTATVDASMDEWLQKSKRAPEVEVGTATVDASMDEWLQATSSTHLKSSKSKKQGAFGKVKSLSRAFSKDRTKH